MTDEIDDLMHEKDVYIKFDGLFADKELWRARRARLIEWFDLRKGPHYTKRQLMDYLNRWRCEACAENKTLDQIREQEAALVNAKRLAPSKSEANGSARRKAQISGTVTGSRELELAAAVSGREILKRQS